MIPAVCFAVLFAGFLAGLAVWVWPDPADFEPYQDDLDTLARHRAAMQALGRREAS